jgi:hypothetical protein
LTSLICRCASFFSKYLATVCHGKQYDHGRQQSGHSIYSVA